MIWFDLDNSPHVPLFRPIFQQLQSLDFPFYVTARDFAQTKDLLDLYHIKHTLIGKHAGKSKIKKILNLLHRSSLLTKNIKCLPIRLAVSHGSRTQLLAAKRTGIPSIVMLDYEYTETKIFNYFSRYVLVPSYIPSERLREVGFNEEKILRYNGFKEELYLKDFIPDPNFRQTLGVSDSDVFVVIRPPSLTANYHDKRSESILLALLRRLSESSGVVVSLVCRTQEDRNLIDSKLHNMKNIQYLTKVVDGLQLVYAADVVISGGGTMNREAALLGTDVYSIFSGRKPYLDLFLMEQGRLRFIEKESDILNIKLQRQQTKVMWKVNKTLASELANLFIELAGKLRRSQ